MELPDVVSFNICMKKEKMYRYNLDNWCFLNSDRKLIL